ncbi:MAG TPA: hypothetical protein EYP36_12705 [Calditrichaeota bacterium]|nr:hypothetical protein [Calditrichota bacterium]
MKKIISIFIIVVILYFSNIIGRNTTGNPLAASTMLTGSVLLAAYLFALLVKNIKLPKLTGYMILGIIFGPAVFNFLDTEKMQQLHFLENLALSFIALTAGGELKFYKIVKRLRSVISILAGQVIFVLVGLFFVLIIFADFLPFLSDLKDNILIGFAILFAGTAVSKSPATTMGIITELKAKGPMTDLVLYVTVLKSILLVLIFPFLIGIAKLYLMEGNALNNALFVDVMIQILSSILFGIIMGYLIIGYIKYIGKENSLFLLGVAIVITEISSMFSMEILLTSIVAGIVVENLSREGDRLIKSIEESSLPLYIIFFSFAGAGLHLDTLQKALGLTLFLVVMRILLVYFGNWAGAKVAKESTQTKQLAWLGFIGQAGIAVGLGLLIERSFPGEIGTTFKTILIGTVVINELLGPVLFKYLLVKVNEEGAEK